MFEIENATSKAGIAPIQGAKERNHARHGNPRAKGERVEDSDQGERRGGEHALDHKRQGETLKIVGQGSAPCAAPASRLRPGTAQIIEAREIKHIRFDAVRADKRALQ